MSVANTTTSLPRERGGERRGAEKKLGGIVLTRLSPVSGQEFVLGLLAQTPGDACAEHPIVRGKISM